MDKFIAWIIKNKKWAIGSVAVPVLVGLLTYYATTSNDQPTFANSGNASFSTIIGDSNRNVIVGGANNNMNYYESSEKITSNDRERTALEYTKIGIKYYNDQKFDEAAQSFEQAFNLNQNIPDLKFYYCMSLFTQDFTGNSDKAYKILYESSESLNDNELVMLALLENNKRSYGAAQKALDKIEQPYDLEDEMFVKYIEISTYVGFNQDFKMGTNVMFNNSSLIERKINDFSPRIIELEKLGASDDATFTLAGEYFGKIADIKEAAISTNLYYFNRCLDKNDSSNLIQILSTTSQYFDVFEIKEDIVKSYFNALYLCYGELNSLTPVHLEQWHTILLNTIAVLERQSTDVYKEDLAKCRQISNDLAKQHNLDWKVYI